MKNSKNTKKALVFSCLSVVLCLTMLIGSTFAWFTDNASTNVNTIQAGTLDIALEMLDGTNWVDAAGKTLGFVKAADAPDNEEVLWEPGCTYELEQLRVKNNGNLALKFKVIINTIGDDEDAQKLAEVLDVLLGDTKVGTLADMMTASATDPDGFIHGTLLAGITSEPYAISLHMQETAGNAYQGLTIDGISVTVLATQDTVEHDSTDNTYDKDAVYPVFVADQQELNAAIAQGGIITLPVSDNQVTLGNNQAIGGDTVIDMSGSSQPIQNSIKVQDGKSLTMSNGTLEKNDTYGKIRFDNKKGLDSEGETQAGIFNDMTFKNTTGGVTDMVQIVPRGDSTGKYIFRNCHFIDANVSINGLAGDEYGDNGQVEMVFENCTFDINGGYAIDFTSNYCTGSITVKDCTFNMAGSSTAIYTWGSKALSLTFAGTNYINNIGANTVKAYALGRAATVTGKDTIATTGTVTIP